MRVITITITIIVINITITIIVINITITTIINTSTIVLTKELETRTYYYYVKPPINTDGKMTRVEAIEDCKEQEPRLDIWRDRCDRWSRKFFCELRKFLGKLRGMLSNSTPK